LRLTSGKDAVGYGRYNDALGSKEFRTDQVSVGRDHVGGRRRTLGLPRVSDRCAIRRRLPIPAAPQDPRRHTNAPG
jgi:hypothetical protein